MRLFLLAIALSACASYPQRFRYKNLPPDLKIIYASQMAVQSHFIKLTGGKGHLDGGEKFNAATTKIRCFYDAKNKTIFVARGEDSCVAHELCHVEGRPASECDKIHVRPI